jgi:hypothetical protein
MARLYVARLLSVDCPTGYPRLLSCLFDASCAPLGTAEGGWEVVAFSPEPTEDGDIGASQLADMYLNTHRIVARMR